jgi:hypothetical protein
VRIGQNVNPRFGGRSVGPCVILAKPKGATGPFSLEVTVETEYICRDKTGKDVDLPEAQTIRENFAAVTVKPYKESKWSQAFEGGMRVTFPPFLRRKGKMRNIVKRVRLLPGRPIWGGWSLILMGSLFWVTVAMAGDVKVITDIKNWHHPVKAVFQKYKVDLDKVELQDKTYAVFYVKKFPYDPMLGHNDNYFNPPLSRRP